MIRNQQRTTLHNENDCTRNRNAIHVGGFLATCLGEPHEPWHALRSPEARDDAQLQLGQAHGGACSECGKFCLFVQVCYFTYFTSRMNDRAM